MLRGVRESEDKTLGCGGRTVHVPRSPLLGAVGVVSMLDCDSSQELGLAHIFQIHTGLPSQPTLPLSLPGGVRIPASTLPSCRLRAARPRPAPQSERQQLEEPLDLCPGASCKNSVLSAELNFGKPPPHLSRRFSSVPQTASCGGSACLHGSVRTACLKARAGSM